MINKKETQQLYTYTLDKGTVVKIDGIPVELQHTTEIKTGTNLEDIIVDFKQKG